MRKESSNHGETLQKEKTQSQSTDKEAWQATIATMIDGTCLMFMDTVIAAAEASAVLTSTLQVLTPAVVVVTVT